MIYISKILKNVLTSLYQELNAAVVCAVLFMFVYMFIKEYGFKETCRIWIDKFKKNKEFRKIFYLVFYIFMILFRTLLCRAFWSNPLVNVIGIWSFTYKDAPYTEGIENIILFVPFLSLTFWTYRDKIFKNNKITFLNILWKSFLISFLASLTIESLQLFFKLGTFQLSDLFFNTAGGVLGGIIYYLIFLLNNKISNK